MTIYVALCRLWEKARFWANCTVTSSSGSAIHRFVADFLRLSVIRDIMVTCTVRGGDEFITLDQGRPKD